MANELAKNVGRLDIVGLRDYATKRVEEWRAAQNPARTTAPAPSTSPVKEQAQEVASQGDEYRRKLREQESARNAEANRRRILSRFGEKEE